MVRGPRLLKSWSSTQRTVALSSGESDLYARNRGGIEALGVVHIAKDLDENLKDRRQGDDRAPCWLGPCEFFGAARMNHTRL